MSFPPELKEQVSSSLKSAQETVKVLRNIESLLAWDQPLSVLTLLNRKKRWIETLQSQGHPLTQILEEVRVQAEEQSDRILRHYPRLFEEACRSEGLDLDKYCRHPRYTFEQQFFAVEINERKKDAVLKVAGKKLAAIGADPVAVAQKVVKEKKRIFERKIDTEAFIEHFYKHYLAVLKEQEKSREDYVSMRSILSSIRREDKKFRFDEFVFDFSRLVRENKFEIEEYRLALRPGPDPDQGIWLHNVENLPYVEVVAFRRR